MVASKLTIIAAMATMNSGHGEIALDAMRQKSAACKKLMRV
jgi:ABC-type cobalamin transport system ATPase subunit